MPWDRIEVDWELILGGNWLARIGILAVIIGVAFFLRLAFDNDWIGEGGRVGLGVAGGLGALALAEYLRPRYQIYAQTLAGGGIALLYLSVFAAFSFYGFLNIYVATAVLFAISASAAAIALRYDSVALAVVGIIGAFTAPFVLGAFGDRPDPLEFGRLAGVETMAYVVIVDLAVLALSTVRNWRWLTLLALLGSLASFGLWYEDSGGDVSLVVAHGSLTAIFLIFVGATTLYHVIWRRVPQAFDQSLMIINAVAYFAISYGLLWEEIRAWMGTFSLLMALFYVAIGLLAFRRSRENFYITLTAIGIAIVFLTVAIPVQLGGPWISVAWATEGAMLFWLSLSLKRPQLRIAGSIVLALSSVWLLAVDSPEAVVEDLTPFLNAYMLSYSIVIGAFALTAYQVWKRADELKEYESALLPALLTGIVAFLAVAVPIQLFNPWMSAAWAVEGAVLVWLAFRLGLRELRFGAVALLLLSAIWLLAIDTPEALVEDLTPFLNVYMLSYAIVIGAFMLTAYQVWKRVDELTEHEHALLPALLTGAIAFVAVAVPIQLFDPWMSAAWAVQGAVLGWLAFRLGLRELRFGAVAVLLLSAIWLLAIDASEALEADLTPFFNEYMLAFMLVIAGFLVAAHRVRQHKDELTVYESELYPALLIAVALFVTVAVPVQVKGPWIALAWSVEALAIVWLSVRYRLTELRPIGAAVFVAAAVRVLAFDTQIELWDFQLIVNLRMMAFVSVILALYLAALLVAWDRRDLESLPARYLVPGLVVAANFLTLWILSAECIAAVDSGIVDVSGDAAFYTKSLGLSLIWTVYASIALVAGILGRWRMVRLAGLGLLAVPILKLFLFDSLALEQGFRVAAFLILGIILLALGFLYQRYSDLVRGFLFEEEEEAAQEQPPS